MDERDLEIAATLVAQIHPLTKLANGYTNYVARSNGADLIFRLSRPYGKRKITVTLNVLDLYDISVIRYGRADKAHLVTVYNDIYADQLDECIHDGIARSCS